MATERGDWIVRKTLDVVEVRIDMVGKYPVLVEAKGRCRAKRDQLWVEAWEPPKRDYRSVTTHWVYCILDSVIRDLPVRQDALESALTSAEHGEQPPLF